MPRFDLSYLLGGFIVMSSIFFLHIFSVEIDVSNREPAYMFYVPDLSLSFSCPSSDDNEADYFQIYSPFLARHGFTVRGSPQDFVAIDSQRRTINFYVTLDDGVVHHVELYSEPPTIRDPEFERDIRALVSQTLKCKIMNVQRQSNARNIVIPHNNGT